MSSEAITQNDLREILSRTVGSVPSEFKKLLWTNPNPSVAFGAQTVVSGIDVSAYDDIEVIIKANINVGIGKSNIFKYAEAGTWAVSGPPSVNDTWVGVRRVTINATSISFGNGGYAYWSSTSANYAHNDYAIPLAVYGIKYERVAPPQVDASDYVIEQGTDGIWTYRKWNSGIAECWERREIGNTTFSLQEGYGYYVGITNRSFPTGLFNANPTITFGVLGGGGLVSFCPNTVSNTYYGGYLWCSVNGTRSIAILSHAIGTWK